MYVFSFTPVVRRVTKRFGMKEVGEDEDWALFWTDCSVALERCMEMRRYQVRLRTNHLYNLKELRITLQSQILPCYIL